MSVNQKIIFPKTWPKCKQAALTSQANWYPTAFLWQIVALTRVTWNQAKLVHFRPSVKRRTFHAPNALETIHNQLKCLIIYCFKCVRGMRGATFDLGLRDPARHSVGSILIWQKILLRHQLVWFVHMNSPTDKCALL